MSEKLLSVIIPTYNMEQLLPRCLDSIVSARHADEVEAIVVNDGSKDRSLEVARRYEGEHEGVVRVVDKPNGNYGSTINAALPTAQGKYVKILDSDDYFDTAELDRLLEAMATTDADMFVTPFTQILPDGQHEVVRYNTMGRQPYRYGEVYDADKVLADGYIRFFLMHALAYRTQMLRQMGYRQTEGISYTDTEWATIPVYQVKTICFLNYNVYQYNFDRPGQTMDPQVLMRSLGQMEQVVDSLIDYYRRHRDELTEPKRQWHRQYLEGRLKNFYKLYLIDMPRSQFDAEQMRRVDEKYSACCRELDLNPKLYPENKIVRFEYIGYYHRRRRRPSQWFEKMNGRLNSLARWFYVRVIRR